MYSQGPGSYQELLVQRAQVFHSAAAKGQIEPFVYPWDTIPAGILILAVLFIPRLRWKHSRWVSYGAFVSIIFSCVSIMQRRSLGLASGYGIGLMCIWGIVWSAVLLVYNDAKSAFQRVEWRDTIEKSVAASHTNGSVNSTVPLKSSLRNRKVYAVFGEAPQSMKKEEFSRDEIKDPSRVLVWQSYPNSIRHRLDWVLDLCTSFRGPGWNWHIQTLPTADYPSPSLRATPSSSTKLLSRVAIRDLLIWYLVVDIVKTTAMNDPYFWGIAPLSSPVPKAAHLPSIVSSSPHLIKLYRLFLSLAAVVSALSLIFTLCPLVFSWLFPLLKLDQVTRGPWSEPLLYPPYWGSFSTSVLDKGLAGWWGKWWHQMFRMGISEPSRALIERLGWSPRSQKSKLLQLLIAFGISGIIHAGASYTAFNPETRPLSGPFAFFFSQAFGILAEQFVFKTMRLSNVMRRWPRLLRRMGTLVYIVTWFYLTGPWLADDFARCGIWLFEPVPISPTRGLGFGAEGEGWWCWHGAWATTWSGIDGTPWWRKGIAI
jgi:Membrane bound O-acyl transferase family